MQYHAIPCTTIQYQAIPCNTMQYHALLCNTMQYHALLITADGAYHYPVGSTKYMAIFYRQNKIFQLKTTFQICDGCIDCGLTETGGEEDEDDCVEGSEQSFDFAI